MRILRPVIGAQALLVLTREANGLLRRRVGLPNAAEFAVIEENPRQLHIGT
jgi:hypothetical protein